MLGLTLTARLLARSQFTVQTGTNVRTHILTVRLLARSQFTVQTGTNVRTHIQKVLRPANSIKVFHDFP
jgi:hypothetical protein